MLGKGGVGKGDGRKRWGEEWRGRGLWGGRSAFGPRKRKGEMNIGKGGWQAGEGGGEDKGWCRQERRGGRTGEGLGKKLDDEYGYARRKGAGRGGGGGELRWE